jgi:WD40 repeat protein
MQNLQGDRLVYSTGENQLMMMKLADKPEDSGKISYFMEPFHTRKITAIAICLKKPLIVTAGASGDNTLRLYSHNGGNNLKLNYLERVTDPIESLDLHPSGIYLVTASKSKLRYYSVCLKRFVLYHETNTQNLNDCNVVKFSHGGQMLAVQENNDIQIYKFFTGERPAMYRFVFHTAPVQDI